MKLFLFVASAMLCLQVNAQVKFSASTIGVLEARQIGPAAMSGRITAIDALNKDPRTFYVGTAGGGIWKTTDAGVIFNPIFDKHCQSIGALVIDQTNPNTIWAGTGESNMRNTVSVGDGLYKSTDSGKTWTKLGLENSEHISKIVIHPKDPNIVFVAVPGKLWSDSQDRGLYKTTDGGITWEKILYVNETTGCADFLINPANPDIMFATTWEFRRKPYSFSSGGKGSAVYKSIDGGKTWKIIKNGLPEGDFGRVAMALAPSAPDNLLAIVEATKTGLFISADGGETWKQQSSSPNVCARPFYFSTIAVDPYDPKRVYRPAFTFSISKDGGYSFTEPSYNISVHADHHALWINPNNTSHLLLGTDGGVYQSLDKGNSWTFFWNLPVSQFYHVATDNQDPYHVYGGLQDNGSWSAPSQKSGGIKNGDWNDLWGGDGFWVQPDGLDNNIVYAESQGGKMARIDTKTNKAQSIQPKKGQGDDELRYNWNTPIVRSTTNPKTLYTGSQYLYKTQDRGITWVKISPDLTTNNKEKQKQEESGGVTIDNSSAENHCTIFTIAESPKDENTVWVGTDDGNLQYTNNTGKTWNNVTNNYSSAGIPAGTWISSISPSAHDSKTVFVTFDNHMYGDMKTYVAKSTDMGQTWKLFSNSEFTGFAHRIIQDPINPKLLFLGTEMGLFATIDGGDNWIRMKANIPEYVLARDMVITPKTHDLVIATHGRGIMIVDDISILRQLSNEILEQDLVMLPNRPTTLTSGKFGGGGGQGGEFVGGNFTEDAIITYYLKERANTGEVRIEIYDQNGRMLYDMAGTKRKGINRVNWGMRMKPPKTAETGAKLDYSGFMSPLVEPGEYKVKLKLNGKEFASNIILVEDPNSGISSQDIAMQRKTSRDMYTVIEDLSFETQKLVNVQKSLESKLPALKSTKDKKLLTDYNNQLETLRKSMVATKTGTAITGEEKMREKLGELFMEVVMYEGRPTEYQLVRLSGFQDEIKQKAEEIGKVNTTYLKKVNLLLEKQKLEPIKLLDKEAWKGIVIKP